MLRTLAGAHILLGAECWELGPSSYSCGPFRRLGCLLLQWSLLCYSECTVVVWTGLQFCTGVCRLKRMPLGWVPYYLVDGLWW
jgi:hypothetical protein